MSSILTVLGFFLLSFFLFFLFLSFLSWLCRAGEYIYISTVFITGESERPDIGKLRANSLPIVFPGFSSFSCSSYRPAKPKWEQTLQFHSGNKIRAAGTLMRSKTKRITNNHSIPVQFCKATPHITCQNMFPKISITTGG